MSEAPPPDASRPGADAPAAAGDGAARADASHAARSGAVQLLTYALQAVLAAYQLVVSRLFGAATFGVYMTSVGIVEVLTRGGLFGADKAMLRYIAAHRAAGQPELEMRALGTGLRLSAGVAALLAVGLMLVAGVIAESQGKPELAVMLRIMAPSVVLTSAMMILAAATLGAKVTRMNFYVRGLGEIGFLLLAVIGAAALGAGSGRLAVAHLVATGTTCALAVVACARIFGLGRMAQGLRAPRHPELLGFAYPVAASEMMNAVLQRSDIVILGFFVGRVDVGIYAAAEYLGRFIAATRYAFDSVACPVLAEALTLRDRARLRYNLALMTRWVATVAAPAAALVIALGPELLSLYGPSFGHGFTALVVLAGAHLMNGAMGLTPWVLMMSGRTRLLFANNLGAALLSVGLNLVLIPRFGILGAAATALVSVTALQLAYAVEAWILERAHCFGVALGKPFLAAAVMLAVQLAVRRLALPTSARVVAVIVVGVACYLVVLFALGPGEEERRMLGRLLGRLRRRG